MIDKINKADQLNILNHMYTPTGDNLIYKNINDIEDDPDKKEPTIF
jgi:hypothetical protein